MAQIRDASLVWAKGWRALQCLGSVNMMFEDYGWVTIGKNTSCFQFDGFVSRELMMAELGGTQWLLKEFFKSFNCWQLCTILGKLAANGTMKDFTGVLYRDERYCSSSIQKFYVPQEGSINGKYFLIGFRDCYNALLWQGCHILNFEKVS